MPIKKTYHEFMDSKCIISIYDRNFEQVGQFGTSSAVVFNRRLKGGSTFRLNVPFREVIGDKGQYTGASNILKENMILVINGNPKLSGFVEDFEINVDVYKENIVIYGKSGQGLANKKIVVPPKKDEAPEKLGWDRVQGNSETVLKHYLYRHLADPVNPQRKIPNLRIKEDLSRGIGMVWQARYTKLNEELEGICDYAGIGYEIEADFMNSEWVADTIHGVDRTDGNTLGNEPVILDMRLGNIENYRYEEDRQSFKNVGYAGGDGEDENRLIYVLNPEISGVDRREVFLDCGNAEHINELIYYGEQKLLDYKENISIDVSILPKAFVLEVDYFLGDKVTVNIEDLGITNDMILTEIEDTWQGGDKHRQKVIFGSESNPLSIFKRQEEVR